LLARGRGAEEQIDRLSGVRESVLHRVAIAVDRRDVNHRRVEIRRQQQIPLRVMGHGSVITEIERGPQIQPAAAGRLSYGVLRVV